MDARRLDWSLLRSFLAVVDQGSLLGAARKLGTYQPTLSRQVAELESQLGAPLFERTGRGLVPTALGLRITDDARRMAEAAAAVQNAMLGASDGTRGTVRLACSQVVATHLLPVALAGLRQAHPGVQIDLVVSNSVSNLLRREADIALRLVPPGQSSLIARRLAQVQMGVYAAATYLEARGRPKQVTDLLRHDLVGLDADPSLLQALVAGGLQAGREHFALRTDDQVAGIALVAAGAGIGFMPRYVGSRVPGLERLLPRLATPSLPLWLVVHREIKGNPLIRTVYDHLVQAVPDALV